MDTKIPAHMKTGCYRRKKLRQRHVPFDKDVSPTTVCHDAAAEAILHCTAEVGPSGPLHGFRRNGPE